MQSLIVSVSDLKWGPDDTQDEMLGRALSYLVLFSTLGIILRWSVGVKLLSVADDPEPILDGENGPKPINGTVASPVAEPEEEPLLMEGSPKNRKSAHFPDGEPQEEEHTNPGSTEAHQRKKAKSNSQDHVFRSFPNTPTWRTPATSSRGSTVSDSEDEQYNATANHSEAEDSEWGGERGAGSRMGVKPARSKFQSRMRKTRKFLVRWIWRPVKKVVIAIKGFMTVPL